MHDEAVISGHLSGTLVLLGDRLHEVTNPVLDDAIAFFFVQEVCKTDGTPHVPNTECGLVASIQRHMREDLRMVHVILF